MPFCFYPRHEHACPHLSHCPHLGGAALGTLVSAANENDDFLRMLQGQIEAERRRNSQLYAENEALQQQVSRLRLELKLERQRQFARGTEQPEAADEAPTPVPAADAPRRKRGAPVGHPGWFRPTPSAYDQLILVDAPATCPGCGGQVRTYATRAPDDHFQEDVVDHRHQVILYRHAAGRCRTCRNWVQQAGPGELLGSRIGPRMRALAVYLRNEIGISCRKVPRALEELFAFSFVPASLLAFEAVLAERAAPLVDSIVAKIRSTEGPVHADETYWSLDGQRAYYWVHATAQYVHFQFDTTRSGQVSRDILGLDFEGTLVTDCYAGYEAHTARAKQKCLAHLARTARDWQSLAAADSTAWAFFEAVKQWVRRGCQFSRQRGAGELSPAAGAAEETWLRAELLRLQSCPLDHDKALTLQGRIHKHRDEWLVFVDDPRVPPTNNLAERALRPLVVLRKLTFGHRASQSARRMAWLMTIKETAKRQGHKVSDFFFRLYTQSPHGVLRHLHGGP
jgi:hypothetical protein